MKRRNCYHALDDLTAMFLFHLTLAAIPLEFSQQLISRFGSPSEVRMEGKKSGEFIFGALFVWQDNNRMLVQVRMKMDHDFSITATKRIFCCFRQVQRRQIKSISLSISMRVMRQKLHNIADRGNVPTLSIDGLKAIKLCLHHTNARECFWNLCKNIDFFQTIIEVILKF